MNGRSSLVTPNRARTRPSESSISISPARITRFLICASQLGPTFGPFRSCPWVRSLGRRDRRAGEEREMRIPNHPSWLDSARYALACPRPPEARNRRNPRVTAVSRGEPYEVRPFLVKPDDPVLSLFPHALDPGGRPLEPRRIRLHADPRARGYGHRSAGAELEGFREVLGEVSSGRADVAGEGEVRHRSHGQVRGTPDARLEHPAAPDWDVLWGAHVVDALRLRDATHAALLDVDDPARSELDRRARVGGRTYRLVEAQIGSDQRLQLRVLDHVVVMQRLLDHEEVAFVEVSEHSGVVERVRGICVDGKQDVGEGVANRANPLDVEARLDLQLDPPIALPQVPGHQLEQRLRRRLDPHRDAALDAVPRATEVLGEGTTERTQVRVEERVDERGLRHGISPDEGEHTLDVVGSDISGRDERGRQQVPKDEPRAGVPLLGVVGFGSRDALAPAFCVVGLDPSQDALFVARLAEARPERTNEWQPNDAQLDRPDPGHPPVTVRTSG